MGGNLTAARTIMSKRQEAGVPLRREWYSIGGLFESGALDAQDEISIEEIVAMRGSMQRMVNPGRGWMTPRYSTDNSRPTPRNLGGPWQRYQAFWERHGGMAVAPSPSYPWGLTWAAVYVMLICDAVTFGAMAAACKVPDIELVERFVAAIRDYGKEQAAPAHRKPTDGSNGGSLVVMAPGKNGRQRPFKTPFWHRKQKQAPTV